MSKSIIPPQSKQNRTSVELTNVTKDITKDILSEFDVKLENDEDIEFEELAAESLAKSLVNTVQAVDLNFPIETGNWGAFKAEYVKSHVLNLYLPFSIVDKKHRLKMIRLTQHLLKLFYLT